MASCGRLAALSQLEYRFNLLSDTLIQPTVVGLVEVTLWLAFFSTTGREDLIGFSKEAYLAYAIWASFMARVSTSWMYEFLMIEDVESGSVNSVLVRPISFYEYYLGQFMGYKLFTMGLSLLTPVLITWVFNLPVDLARFPVSILLVLNYLILVHTISFMIASLGFFFTRIHHLTVAKNITLWFLTGEFFPLDLVPDFLKPVLMNSPFAAGVFVPIGYMTGRHGLDVVGRSFLSVWITIFLLAPLAYWLWMSGRKRYSGTGA